MMNREFTPAAERALLSAARWRRLPGEPVGPVQLLLGLLDEPECRGAALLAARGIDADVVRCRWPELRVLGGDPRLGKDAAPTGRADSGMQEKSSSFSVASAAGPIPLSNTVWALLREAEGRLNIELTSAALATEHLLLGLISGDHEVARWLREQGVDATELEAEILRLHGVPTEAPAFDVPIGPPLDIPDELRAGGATDAKAENDRSQAPATPPSEGQRRGGAAETATEESSVDLAEVASRCLQRPVEAAEATAGAARETAADGARLIRILDAAANRAAEAARVVEDYVRFLLDDGDLTAHCKQLRHDLTAALAAIPRGQRLAARDTRQDVGTRLSTAAESRRSSMEDVLGANFGRLEQALRSLEEFGKLLGAATGDAFKQLRYRAYTLEKAVIGTVNASRRLQEARLYVLIDGCETDVAFERLVGQLVRAGVPLIQLRDKRLNDRQLLQRARRLRELTRGTATRFIVNDRPDVARLAGADGVHVGQDELGVSDVRAVVGSKRLVGVSTHSIEQARKAVLDGADYIGVGPVFPSATKQFDEFVGLEILEAVAREIRLPAFAIGGIDATNLDRVLATGIGRVAVARAVSAVSNPYEAARRLLGRLESNAVDAKASRS